MLQTLLKNRKSFTKKPYYEDSDNILGEQLEQVNTDSGRYYKTPAGVLYPSVTTVTGLMGADAIKEWRARVGEEEANKISKKASTRGTRIHQLCEDYIDGSEIDPKDYDYNDFINFTLLKKVIDDNIDNIHMQEVRLYSDYLKMAGTVDCVAEFQGRLSIIDFKTAKKPKNREYITNYFCQAAAYAIMYEERTSIPVSKIIIIISVDDDEVQIFEDRRDHYVTQLLEVREKYRLTYNV